MRTRSHWRSVRFAALAAAIGLTAAGYGASTAGGASAAGPTASAPDPTAPSGTLTIAVAADPLGLDPQMHRNRLTQVVSRTIHDNLLYVDTDGDYVANVLAGMSVDNMMTPKLAESIEKIDPLTWEVVLRQGISFHNGEPFNAEAVKYTFDRLFDPEINSPRANMQTQSAITEIEVVDEFTVRFHTEYDVGDSPVVLGMYSQEIIAPGHAASLSPEEFGLNPVGTGPFKFVEWVPGQHLVLEANTEYWDGPPKVERLVFRTIPEPATRVSEFLAGSVDVIYDLDPDTAALLAERAEIVAAPGNSVHFLSINVADGPLASEAARHGLNYAVDRELITHTLYGGTATPLLQINNEIAEARVPDGDLWSYDPDKARELLADVNEPLELTTTAANALASEVLAEQFRQVGLDVTVVVLENAAFSEMMQAGELDLAYFTFGQEEWLPFYSNHFSCAAREAGVIYTGFCDEELDAQMEAAQLIPDEAERFAAYQEVASAIDAQAPWVPLWVPSFSSAVSERVHGWLPSTIGLIFPQLVSVD